MKKFVHNHPLLFGVLISPSILALVAVWAEIEGRYPSVDRFLDSHPGSGIAISFTLMAFVVWFCLAWRWHRLRGYWPSLILFFVLHIAGVLVYIRTLGPISGFAWKYVLVAESYLLAFFVYCGTHLRSLRRAWRAHRNGLSAQSQNGVGGAADTE